MRRFFLMMGVVLSSTVSAALAQTTPVPTGPAAGAETLPVASTATTPPTDGLKNLPPMDSRALDDGAPIRLTPDGPAVINLDRDAATVIVGNPTHASATMENPRMIMLMPLAPGATKIIALDRDGKAILSRHVLVGGGKTGFMRINRVCAVGKAQGCQPQSVYYCPDKCYQTTVNTEAATGSMPQGPAPAAETGDTSGGSNDSMISTPDLGE